ncbi:MAG: HNH endonuclease family protein, partial [Limisphaerales bacterium]
EKCLGLIESFVVRRAVCNVPTNALNKLFTQWTKNFPDDCHAAWLLGLMSSGNGSRRYPTDAEFKDALERQPQYGRGTTRFILCSLEKSFEHKEPVNLDSTTIEHVLPQTLTDEWKTELGPEFERIHTQFADTFGNLTLTGYNPELGNIPFSEKKAKLQNTHIELNRWIIEQSNWSEEQILARAEVLSAKAVSLWPGPTATTL